MVYRIKLVNWETLDMVRTIILPHVPNVNDVIDFSENGGFHFEVSKRKFDPHFNFSLDNPEGHYNVTLKGTVKETKDNDRPFHI